MLAEGTCLPETKNSAQVVCTFMLLQPFLHDGKHLMTRQSACLTRALMNDDLPTFAAPNTYTLRPLRSRKMAEATSETPCPAGLPTR